MKNKKSSSLRSFLKALRAPQASKAIKDFNVIYKQKFRGIIACD